MTDISVRVALQQRVLPEYRAPFFNALGAACSGGLEVFAGLPRTREAIATVDVLTSAQFVRARNMHLFSGKTYFCIQRGFIRWLESFHPQVLIVEANPRYLSTPAAIQWMHRRHLPVIGWGLGAPGTRKAGSLLRRQFLRSLDAVIAYSKSGADQYIKAGFAPERVFVAPNAVSPCPTAPALTRPPDFRNGKPSLLFVGRLQERKRLDVLLHACSSLPAQLQPDLVIVGDGPDRQRLEQLAQKHYPAAIFAGARHGVDLEKFFSSADLFVLPGTGGLAVQQAMAHALPVLVGEADGTQSDLVRPANGWVLPAVNADSLAAKLTTALADVAQLRRMGAASYRIVHDEVNLENMVNVFMNAIEAVLQD